VTLAETFTRTFGRPPQQAWAAPGRINLIGEHTDYNEGFVLPLAVAERVVAVAAPRSDRLFRLHSVQIPGPVISVDLRTLADGSVPGWAAYPAGVAWALARAGHQPGGADLLVDGTVPLGAGLSSSAALECAVASALNGLFEFGLEPGQLAAVCTRAENDFVAMPCGVMDQLVAMMARAGSALFIDTRTLQVEHIPLALDGSGLGLLVIDTGAPRQLVDSSYARRRRECQEAARAAGVSALRDATLPDLSRLPDDRWRRRARHVITENERVLDAVARLRAGRPGDLGPLMTASHRSLRDDFEVSSPPLDVAVATALAAGALGARLTGGGFGGCAIALARASDISPIEAAVADAFISNGWSRPVMGLAVPSAGAGPVDLDCV
jgi:galactokinase